MDRQWGQRCFSCCHSSGVSALPILEKSSSVAHISQWPQPVCSGHHIPSLVQSFFPLSPFIPTLDKDHPSSPVSVLVSSPMSKYNGSLKKPTTHWKQSHSLSWDFQITLGIQELIPVGASWLNLPGGRRYNQLCSLVLDVTEQFPYPSLKTHILLS